MINMEGNYIKLEGTAEQVIDELCTLVRIIFFEVEEEMQYKLINELLEFFKGVDNEQ